MSFLDTDRPIRARYEKSTGRGGEQGCLKDGEKFTDCRMDECKIPTIFGCVNNRGIPFYSLTFVNCIASVAFVTDGVETKVVFE